MPERPRSSGEARLVPHQFYHLANIFGITEASDKFLYIIDARRNGRACLTAKGRFARFATPASFFPGLTNRDGDGYGPIPRHHQQPSLYTAFLIGRRILETLC